jgi:hypothetical protein
MLYIFALVCTSSHSESGHSGPCHVCGDSAIWSSIVVPLLVINSDW